MTNNVVLEKDLQGDGNNKKRNEWRTIGVRIRNSEIPVLNRQLDRLNYSTLGDLVKDLVNGKITRLTEEKQIEIMNNNLQLSNQIIGLIDKPYNFYKQINLGDFLQYMLGK